MSTLRGVTILPLSPSTRRPLRVRSGSLSCGRDLREAAPLLLRRLGRAES